MDAELNNVLEVKTRRIESDAQDLLTFGHCEVRLRRILSDIRELRAERDAALLREHHAGQ